MRRDRVEVMGRISASVILIVCMAGTARECAMAQAVRVMRQTVRPENSVSSLTVMASPAAVNFNLVSGGVATGSTAVQVTTTWSGSLCLLTCTINMYAYFSNANAALSSGTDDIPSSEVLGRVTTGSPTTYTAFTQTSPFGGAGASLQLYQQSFFLLTGGGSRTDPLNLEINLSSQKQLPAGTYTGVLYIQAQSL